MHPPPNFFPNSPVVIDKEQGQGNKSARRQHKERPDKFAISAVCCINQPFNNHTFKRDGSKRSSDQRQTVEDFPPVHQDDNDHHHRAQRYGGQCDGEKPTAGIAELFY